MNYKEEFNDIKKIRADFDEAEMVWDFLRMQDAMDRVSKYQYLYEELRERYNAVYANPSKDDDYSNSKIEDYGL